MSIIVVGLVVQDGGVHLSSESAAFLSNYLDNRSAAQKIFDPARDDWTLYQARELSYFFDYLDAQVVGYSMTHGLVQWYSVVFVASLLAMVFVFQYGCRRYFGDAIPQSICLMLSFIVLTSPGYFWEFGFYRSAKVIAALLLEILCWTTLDVLSNANVRPTLRRMMTMIGLPTLLLCLIDRQGAFLAAAYCVSMIVATVTARLSSNQQLQDVQERLIRIGRVSLASVVAGAIYNLVVGPWIIRWINGYSPDFAFQIVHLSALSRVFQAISLGGDNVGYIFGNSGRWGGMAVCVLVAVGILLPHRDAGRTLAARVVAVFFGISIAAAIVMLAAMLYREPGIAWPENRFTYFLPLSALLIFFVALAIRSLNLSKWKPPPIALFGVLAVIVVANVVSLPGHLVNLESGVTAQWAGERPTLFASLSDPQVDYADYPMNPITVNFINLIRRRQSETNRVQRSQPSTAR